MIAPNKTIDTATAEVAVRLNTAPEGVEVDRTDHTGIVAAVSAASPSGQVPRPAEIGPGAPFTVVPAAAQGRADDRPGPLNVHELNALLAQRARENATANAADLSPKLSLAAQTCSALAVLDADRMGQAVAPVMPPAEAEARAKLQAAIDRRAGAREAIALQEAALAKAQAVEQEAIVEEGRHRLTEMEGGDGLARRITKWSTEGGERPELAPDPTSMEARHAGDRARVHAAAAKHAVAAISTVLQAQRGGARGGRGGGPGGGPRRRRGGRRGYRHGGPQGRRRRPPGGAGRAGAPAYSARLPARPHQAEGQRLAPQGDELRADEDGRAGLGR